ncbi:MAG: DegT/DnrJ/EryC1/StrS family aminotransferase [Treponemataceae bacterium]
MKIQPYSSTIRRKEMDAVLTCMVEEKIGPGESNFRLIQQVKEYFGVDGALAVRSPAIALKYALKALALEPSSKIMISALAPAWQYLVIKDFGYEPMVLDVSLESGLCLPEVIHEAIKNGGRLLILHETMGLIPNISAILELGIPVIEDISQSAGASLGDKKVGTFGVFSILGLEENDIITAGGGAVIMAPQRRDWLVLKKHTDLAPGTDILPDMNCALALIQLKEHNRNEALRKEIYEVYIRSLMQGKHHSFIQTGEYAVPVVYSFPVILESGFKEVKQYANRKDIEIVLAFEDSVTALLADNLEGCINAKSLYLRCVLFPLYPRLGKNQSLTISKVLSTLP